jgi:hypothetical protein
VYFQTITENGEPCRNGTRGKEEIKGKEKWCIKEQD